MIMSPLDALASASIFGEVQKSHALEDKAISEDAHLLSLVLSRNLKKGVICLCLRELLKKIIKINIYVLKEV